MSFIGEFIIDFIGEAIASSPTLQRVLLWILFSASLLLLLVPVMTGEYAWSILSISAMLFSVVMIDGTREHGVQDAKNGGAYHYFLLTVGTFCVAAIVLLAALSLVGVPPVASTPQVDGINFAPWYVAASALVLLLFFYNAAQHAIPGSALLKGRRPQLEQGAAHKNQEDRHQAQHHRNTHRLITGSSERNHRNNQAEEHHQGAHTQHHRAHIPVDALHTVQVRDLLVRLRGIVEEQQQN